MKQRFAEWAGNQLLALESIVALAAVNTVGALTLRLAAVGHDVATR